MTLSPAFVEKAEPIAGSETRDNGLVRLRVRAHVRITKLLDALAAGKIKTRPVTKTLDTASLLAQLITKSDQHAAQEDILAKLLNEYPEAYLTVEQSDKEFIEKKPGGRIFLSVPLSIKPNQDAYIAFSTKLCELLAATKRASGEFKVDGERYGPNADYAKRQLAHYLKSAFTDNKYMLGIFPRSLQGTISRSCDGEGKSTVVGMGPAYHLWDGSDRQGIGTLEYGEWRDLRTNSSSDWIVICISDSKKDYRQTTWRWFHIKADEFQQWFSTTPESFVCRTDLLDEAGEAVVTDTIELSLFGARRMYPNLLWCVPVFVNTSNASWYTPELRLVRGIEVDAEDVAKVRSFRTSLERAAKPKQ